MLETARGEKLTKYKFFDDPERRRPRRGLRPGRTSLARLVNALKSAAQGYGIEKRVLLLHGPVGSSKSTIARLLKKGLEKYTGRDEGALYSLGWADPAGPDGKETVHWCPMNEEPLHLIPQRFRGRYRGPAQRRPRRR